MPELMNLTLECIPCIINSLIKLVRSGVLPEEFAETGMRRLLVRLAEVDYHIPPPAFGREMHRMIRRLVNDPDPYRSIKKNSNKRMLEMQQAFEEMVLTAKDPFDMALRLAIAANVIDFGLEHRLDLMETLNRAVHAQFAVDDSHSLRADVHAARTVLYIGDNCGEIVLDKLFLKTIRHPNVYFVVRGSPIINDATMADAALVKMEEVAKVITTGDDAPGVVWETASDEFKRRWDQADVIIAKGQGNLEGLMEISQNIYFLLITKCDVIARHIGVTVGDFVVMGRRTGISNSGTKHGLH